ncbi:MAG: class I SAM-dependent methyltransferase [Pyrinomonadaceae bacterium]
MLQETYFDIAPCLQEGPISRQAQSVVTASRMLGSKPWASIVKAWCVPYLFESLERIAASGEEPVEALNQSLETLTQFLLVAAGSGFGDLGGAAENGHKDGLAPGLDVKEVTGEHYGRLFREFSSASFWDEPVRLLRQRLERNGIAVADIKDKRVLDAGCGGGRYTVAWRLLGAKPVVGLDVSTTGLTDAKRRAAEAGIDGVVFERGNVLDLHFAADTFDVVYSNGVLHHTTDWAKGVAELVRVLKPGGLGWLYLIENPGGLFWDVIEILRAVMKDEQRDTARAALHALGMPANRIFYMLDHVMVPINVRLTPEEIEGCLRAAGAKDIRRLERGTDFDRVEQIHQNKPFAAVHYGVGENRYVFSK